MQLFDTVNVPIEQLSFCEKENKVERIVVFKRSDQRIVRLPSHINVFLGLTFNMWLNKYTFVVMCVQI